MSTIKVTNLRHESASSSNITLDSSNNVTTANNFTAGGTIGCTGNLTVTSGNLVLSSGNGIDFSADGNAGGMTSELLEDYEEGTFDPTLQMTLSGSVTLNSSYNTLSYTKIGRLVTISGQLRIDTVSSPSGDIRITDLPFTVRSTTELGRVGGGLYYFDDSAGTGNHVKPVPWVAEESTTYLYVSTRHYDGGLTPGASDEISFSCTYVAA